MDLENYILVNELEQIINECESIAKDTFGEKAYLKKYLEKNINSGADHLVLEIYAGYETSGDQVVNFFENDRIYQKKIKEKIPKGKRRLLEIIRTPFDL